MVGSRIGVELPDVMHSRNYKAQSSLYRGDPPDNEADEDEMADSHFVGHVEQTFLQFGIERNKACTARGTHSPRLSPPRDPSERRSFGMTIGASHRRLAQPLYFSRFPRAIWTATCPGPHNQQS